VRHFIVFKGGIGQDLALSEFLNLVYVATNLHVFKIILSLQHVIVVEPVV